MTRMTDELRRQAASHRVYANRLQNAADTLDRIHPGAGDAARLRVLRRKPQAQGGGALVRCVSGTPPRFSRGWARHRQGSREAMSTNALAEALRKARPYVVAFLTLGPVSEISRLAVLADIDEALDPVHDHVPAAPGTFLVTVLRLEPNSVTGFLPDEVFEQHGAVDLAAAKVLAHEAIVEDDLHDYTRHHATVDALTEAGGIIGPLPRDHALITIAPVPAGWFCEALAADFSDYADDAPVLAWNKTQAGRFDVVPQRKEQR